MSSKNNKISKYRILLVEDNKEHIEYIANILEPIHEVLCLNPLSSKIAEQDLSSNIQAFKNIDLILLDLDLYSKRDFNVGLELITSLREVIPHIPIIVVTTNSHVNIIVKAMKNGAANFFSKDNVDINTWYRVIRECIESVKAIDTSKRVKNIMQNADMNTNDNQSFIAKSESIINLKKELSQLAKFPTITVLLTGETGVGKEVAAHYLHTNGPRKDSPFVAINLSAIPKELLESSLFGHIKGAFTGAAQDHVGYFEQAEGGILFLDEIGEINQDIQVKLLRFLQDKIIRPIGSIKDKKLDVQIVSATNKDLKNEVQLGYFREDLYQRLKNYDIYIPALRNRKEDILPLIAFYMNREENSLSEIIEKDALKHLVNYNWGGNIRELKNAVEYMKIKSTILDIPLITKECLPADIQSYFRPTNSTSKDIPDSLEYKMAQKELAEIDSALHRMQGRKQAAAELLGLNAEQLHYKVTKKYASECPELLLNFLHIVKAYKLN